MKSKASTVKEYLADLPPERRKAIQAVRKVIRANLPKGYEEGMQYGAISYFVPHRIYPWGYHCDPKVGLPYAGLASQKNHLGIYLMCIYGDPAHEKWFRSEWKKSGKKLDMGKSCVRFKKIEDVPLDVIGKAIKRVPPAKFIAHYEASLEGTTAGKKLARAKEKAAAGRSTKKTARKKAESAPRRKTAKR